MVNRLKSQRLPSATAAFFISNTDKAHLVAASPLLSAFQISDALASALSPAVNTVEMDRLLTVTV